MAVSLSSEELNFVVYRYLLESGFTHTAFVFGYESHVHKSEINGDMVPTGTLITTFQKGLQYLELEANLAAEDAEADSAAADYSNLSARELITKDLDELKATLAQRSTRSTQQHRSGGRARSERAERAAAARDNGGGARGGAAGAAGRADAGAASASPTEIPASQVTTLEGHTNEVFICAWSPSSNMLASGSGDSTARIWDLGAASRGSPPSRALAHTTDKSQASKDVTTLDWNGDGSLLATGSYDGIARIWSSTGELKNVLSAHKGPIFSLKWNKKGDLLLSGSVDKTAIIWDGASGLFKQQFEFHTAPTLDVDWRDDSSFASCSTDKQIFVCQLGKAEPLIRLSGHTDEVNAVKWDSAGKLLASCSDDGSAKIWRVDRATPVHDFTAHSKEIYTIKWSPTGPGSANPGMRQLLVTASFDHTIRLWDTESGTCINTLTAHTQPVYSVAFSPNGQYLASGSFDKMVDIWNVADGRLIKTYRGLGGIFEVCWNKDGDKIAACFSNKTVSVIDLKL